MTKGKTPPKPRALVDLDGTLADFDGSMSAALTALQSPEEPSRLAHDDEDKYPYVKARRNMIKSQPGFWFNLKKLEPGFKVLDIMRELGFRLTVLTRGPKSNSAAWAEKKEWSEKYIPDARVNITSDEKALVYGRVLMDDWTPYVVPWLKVRQRGLVIMPDQPWNQGFEHPRVIRLKDNYDEVRAALIAQRERKPVEEDDEDEP
jgi:hypothetical protein